MSKIEVYLKNKHVATYNDDSRTLDVLSDVKSSEENDSNNVTYYYPESIFYANYLVHIFNNNRDLNDLLDKLEYTLNEENDGFSIIQDKSHPARPDNIKNKKYVGTLQGSNKTVELMLKRDDEEVSTDINAFTINWKEQS